MKKIILILLTIILISGCSKTLTGKEFKKVIKLKYKKCKDILNNTSDDIIMHNDIIIASITILSNCESKEEILEEIRKLK